MIERFNFYDVRGYLLPGFALLAVAWLPYGLVTDRWPASEGFSIVAALILAWLAGALLQSMTASLMSIRTLGGRAPSHRLLDGDDLNLDTATREALVTRIEHDLGIDVTTPDTDLELRRQTAFARCRSALVQQKQAAYAEQFEGMFALMRGICVAAAAGSAWAGGWLARSFGATGLIDLLAIVSLLALLISLLLHFLGRAAEEQSGSLAFLLMTTLFLGGFSMGAGLAGSDHHVSLAVSMLALAFIAARAYSAYVRFTVIFARTVYLDYLRLG
ncbi:MAG TPA: hypothetical protein VGF69_22615 [Thermoanaerobaculia bacterium]|jgi:hypothetical protein